MTEAFAGFTAPGAVGFCARCGASRAASDAFCGQCGVPIAPPGTLPAAAHPGHAAAPPTAPPAAPPTADPYAWAFVAPARPVSPTGAPHRLVTSARPRVQLPLRYLLPVEEFRDAKAWLRGWVAFFALAAIAPFLLLQAVSNDTDLHRAAIGFAVYFAVVWGVAIHSVIRPQTLPVGLLIRVGLFTSIAGIAIALFLEKHIDASTDNVFTSILTVGAPEEIAKAAPIVLFMLLGTREFNVRTYMFVGAVSGLVFGAVEAVSYSSLYEEVLQVLGDSPTAVISEVWRLLTDGLFHACMAGLSAFFIGLAWHVRSRQVALVAVGISVAAVMHGLYDNAANHWVGTCIAAAIVVMFLGYARSADRITRELMTGAGSNTVTGA